MFTFETPHLDLEIYGLLTILEASPALARSEGSESDERKLGFLRKWEFPEISRVVVSLAAIVRSSLDAADPVGGGDDYYGAALKRQVGRLVPDQGKPDKRKPPDFREACNKVLHADSVEPETATAPRGTTAPLTGRLVL